MRIIGGRARATKLDSTDDIHTRPTLDRIKENIFNLINIGYEDIVVLDLFAGSGALGIEALSRGAKFCYFCDNNRNAIKTIRQNLIKTRFIDNSLVFNSDYTDCLNKIKAKLDLIFLDPPYESDLIYKSLIQISKLNILNKNTEIILETDDPVRIKNELDQIKGYKIIKEKNYGRVSIIIICLL